MESSSHTSVRTISALPESFICGSYPGIFTLGINCSDVRTTANVLEVELHNDQLVPSCRPSSVQSSRSTSFQRLPSEPSNWTICTSPARDRYEQNLEVYRSRETGEAYLRTVREIREGEELFVWYSEELARELSIPILTPANVQGNLEYVCTSCSASFQYPNPLKAHIRFHCQQSGKHSPDSPMCLSARAQRCSPSEGFKTTPSGPSTNQRDSLLETLNPRLTFGRTEKSTKSTNALISNEQNLTKPSLLALNYMSQFLTSYPDPHGIALLPPFRFPFFPAFIPYGTLPPVIPYKDQSLLPDRIFTPAGVSVSGGTSASISSLENPRENYEIFQSTAAVDVELGDAGDDLPRMVYTNGRKSKRGYLCVYCGKLYSRKYGLKIHVRTHTGFKPLKCKVCLRPFGDPSNLNKHIRLHAEGDTPYKCHHCGKVLVRRRDLERHIRSRHSSEVVNFSDNMSDDNATAVTSSMSIMDEQDVVDVDDMEHVDVI